MFIVVTMERNTVLGFVDSTFNLMIHVVDILSWNRIGADFQLKFQIRVVQMKRFLNSPLVTYMYSEHTSGFGVANHRVQHCQL